MGKVGSSSLRKTLKMQYPGQVIHAHNYQMMAREDRHLINHRKEYRLPLNIITPVRDPVSRNISSFFQNFQRDTGFNFHDRSWKRTELRRLFLREFPHQVPLEWFDRHFRTTFKVDIFTIPFPRKKKWDTIKKGAFRFLIYRCDLDRKKQLSIISQFLSVDLQNWSYDNLSTKKEYAAAYEDFIRNIRLPDIYLTLLTKSRFCRHFWTEQEITALVERWTETQSVHEQH